MAQHKITGTTYNMFIDNVRQFITHLFSTADSPSGPYSLRAPQVVLQITQLHQVPGR